MGIVVANTPWLLHILSAVVYLALGVFVVTRRPYALLNRVCGVLILCFFVWSACLAVSHHPDSSKATAALFYSIGSIAWASFASIAVAFTAAFLRPALFRSTKFWLAIAIPPLVVIHAQWTGRLAADYLPRPWGYAYVWQTSLQSVFFYTYYGIFMVGGIGALYLASRRAATPVVRRQARIICLSAVAPLLLSSLTDVWLPRAGIYALPNMAPDFTILWVVGLVYAIVRYRMLELTPAVAADRVVETMSEAVFLVELDGRIAWSNPAAGALLGHTNRALVGRQLTSLVATVASPSAVPQGHALAWRLAGVGRQDVVMAAANGTAIDVDLAVSEVRGGLGELVGYVCVAADITPRKRTEADLRRARDELEQRVAERTGELESVNLRLVTEIADRKRSEDRYRLLIESMHEGLWVLDAEDTTTLVNSRLAEILGFSVDELIGRKPVELSIDRAATYETLRVAHVGQAGNGDWELRRKDGKLVTAIVQASPLFDPVNAYAGAVLTVMDVTERKQLQAQLARSDRLASLGLLAAGIGHEINNPLTYVMTNLEEIIGAGVPLVSARAADALDGARRVREIVRDLRTFSRADGSERTLVDVHHAIEDAIKIAHHEVRFRARMVRKFGTNLPLVLAQRRGLSQVFVNLLVNAGHAIERGSVEDNEVRIETCQDGDLVRIVVSDTGKGIAPDQLDRIFDPFHSTKQTGVGLGLAICHELVASLGGKITVTSELGHGSRFTIELPAGRGVPAQPPASQPVALAQAPGGRVLVIDDEPGIRDALARMLGRYFDVVTCESATAAQALLHTDPDFDVVFCDLMMPGTTGIALAQWLASELPEVEPRVVFMTGGAFTPEANDFLAKTTHAVLEKPFLTEDLIRLAHQTIGRR